MDFSATIVWWSYTVYTLSSCPWHAHTEVMFFIGSEPFFPTENCSTRKTKMLPVMADKMNFLNFPPWQFWILTDNSTPCVIPGAILRIINSFEQEGKFTWKLSRNFDGFSLFGNFRAKTVDEPCKVNAGNYQWRAKEEISETAEEEIPISKG